MNVFKSFFSIIFFAIIGIGLYVAVSDFTGNDYLRLDPTGLVAQGQKVFGDKISLFKKPAKFKIAVLSDTHSDSEETAKAIVKAKELGAQQIIVTGDLTQVGSIDELMAQKRLFDEANVPYKVIPGDHDLYNSAGTDNFKQVFGSTYQSYISNGVKFLLLDGSDANQGLGDEQIKWIRNELSKRNSKITFVFMHLPPYHNSSTRTIYQKATTDGEVNQKAKEETKALFKAMKDYGAKDVFSGDHHLSNRYQEPDYSINVNVVGAVTRERNLQTPRFNMIEIYEDDSYGIYDIEIDKWMKLVYNFIHF